MTLWKAVACNVAAGFLAACGTIEDSAWTNGVRREEALEIRSALQTQKKAHEIFGYQQLEDGSILVQSDVGSFKARRVREKWVFVEVAIVT